MIERRPFKELPSEDFGWLKARRHFSAAAHDEAWRKGWGCLSAWNDQEVTPNARFALRAQANAEIVTYVRAGTVTHTDSLGNKGKLAAGNIQVLSAGTGVRHAEYNSEQAPARMFQICITPLSRGGSPAWASQPCPGAECCGRFVALASGFDSDHDALPIRALARILKAKLKVGESIEYVLRDQRLAYLVPCSGTVDINGVRIYARDGAAIKEVSVISITAIEEADVVMADVH
jgi:redox-sensitive bicupin YhaK (pirin superfamily)